MLLDLIRPMIILKDLKGSDGSKLVIVPATLETNSYAFRPKFHTVASNWFLDAMSADKLL
jgi:hypothetical protein